MSPGGSGASVTYSVTATYTSPSNALQVWLKFGDIAGGCNVLFQFTSNAVFLLSNDASTWGPGYQMGSAGTQSNPQCNINNSTAGYTFSGNSVAAHVTLNFLPAFAGPRAISAQAYSVDGTTSAWASASSPWTVPGSSGPPVVNSVYAGSESSQITRTFTIFGTDPAGSSNVMYQWIQFGSTVNGCNLLFEPNLSRVSLLNDAGSSWGTPLTLGTSGTLENTQCSFPLSTAGKTLFTNGASSFATITFKSAFAGTRPIAGIMYGYNGLNSGWYNAGSWTIPTMSTTIGDSSGVHVNTDIPYTVNEGFNGGTMLTPTMTRPLPHVKVTTVSGNRTVKIGEPLNLYISGVPASTQVWIYERCLEDPNMVGSYCLGGYVGTTNPSGIFSWNTIVSGGGANWLGGHVFKVYVTNWGGPSTGAIPESGNIGPVAVWIVDNSGNPANPAMASIVNQ